MRTFTYISFGGNIYMPSCIDHIPQAVHLPVSDDHWSEMNYIHPNCLLDYFNRTKKQSNSTQDLSPLGAKILLGVI